MEQRIPEGAGPIDLLYPTVFNHMLTYSNKTWLGKW